MTIFLTLLLKLIPLYLMILLGFIAAKVLGAQRETVAKLLIYIIAPAVVFYGTFSAELTLANLSLPVLFFLICCSMCLVFFGIGKIVYKNDSTKNILAFTAGAGNTGYFGLPVALMLFGDEAFCLAVLAILGYIFYENSLGFYITAKGNYTARESLMKVVRLPTIYAFFVGIICNLLNLNLGEIGLTTIEYFKGAYSLLGMMIIGMGLATVCIRAFDFKFISLSFLAKFIVWPIIMLSLVALDRQFFQFYDSAVYGIFILMAIVPLAANTVTLATELKAHPEKAAVAVLLSTVFALFYIPLMVGIFVY